MNVLTPRTEFCERLPLYLEVPYWTIKVLLLDFQKDLVSRLMGALAIAYWTVARIHAPCVLPLEY